MRGCTFSNPNNTMAKKRTYDKRIVQHCIGTWIVSDGYILSNDTYRKSLDFYNELATEAKRDFPHLKDQDINPFVVIKSNYNQGTAGIHFSLKAKTTKEGYNQHDHLDFQRSC